MKPALRLTLLALIVSAGGCTVPERSRALNDANVSATTSATQVCVSCHGAGGNAMSGNFPNLAGQQKGYLIEQLKAYRSHSRSDADAVAYMWGMTAHLSDAQIDGLASYYASQAPHAPHASAPATSSAGATLYQQGIAAANVVACASCHGSSAEGSTQFPRLAGQHGAYLVKQLMIFQKTNQRPEGAVMQTMAHNLTVQNMRDVAVYLEGLGPR